MTKTIAKICKILFFSSFVFFASCSTEITLELQKNGSVKLSCAGNFDGELAKIFFSQNNFDGDFPQNEKNRIDETAFSDLLKNFGFSDIKIASNNFENFYAEAEDKFQKSSLFSAGLFKIKNNSVKIDFSPENLKKFYDSANEETKMNLDLLLAPVFNDEKMSPEEYIEMLATFYGEKIANELKNFVLKINLIDASGKKEKYDFPAAKLLCGE